MEHREPAKEVCRREDSCWPPTRNDDNACRNPALPSRHPLSPEVCVGEGQMGAAKPCKKATHKDRDHAHPVHRNALSECCLRILARSPNVEAEAAAGEEQ